MATEPIQKALPTQLLFRREVGAWMDALVDKSGTYEGAPQNRDDVYRDVLSLWEEKGFLNANELKKELALKYMQNADPEMQDVIRAVHSYGEMRDIDELSGGLRKTHLDTMTGLAQLYAIEMDKPVTVIELDFSNMGGTNLFFKQLIAEGRGVALDQVEDEEAEALTDRCAKIVANTIRDTIHHVTGIDDEICIRAGGDELRFLLPEVDIKKYPNLKNDIHTAIQDVTARLGLHDHPYLKEITNKYKQGFGAAVEVKDMREIKDKAKDLRRMDASIKLSKTSMGYEKHGEIREDIVRRAVLRQIDKDEKILERTQMSRDELADALVGQKRKRAEARLALFDVLKQGKQEGVDPVERLDAVMHEIEAVEAKNRFNVVSHSDVLAEEQTLLQSALDAGGLSNRLFESLEDRLKASVDYFLEENNVELNDYERQVLNNTLSILSPTDPVTKTWLDRDMPATTEIFMEDVNRMIINLKYGLNDPNVQRMMKNHDMDADDLDDLKAQGLRIGFHNLAGLNNLLGQNGANVVLEDWAQNVLMETLEEKGLQEGDHYRIAHYGGGEFQVIFPPVVGVQKWGLMLIDDAVLESVVERVREKIDVLNQTNIAEDLKQKGVKVDGLDDTMTYSQVLDAKDERHGWGDGMFVSAIHGALEAGENAKKTPGGAALYAQFKALGAQTDLDRSLRQLQWRQNGNDNNNEGGSPWEKQEIS